MGVKRSHPFNLSYTAESLDRGNHTLTIIVEDDIGNRIEENIPFSLEVSTLPPGVSFSTRSYTIKQDSFPVGLILSHRKLEELQNVSIYLEPVQGGDKKRIVEIKNFESSMFNNQISTTWSDPPTKGSYILSAEITTNNGSTSVSDEIPIEMQ